MDDMHPQSSIVMASTWRERCGACVYSGDATAIAVAIIAPRHTDIVAISAKLGSPGMELQGSDERFYPHPVHYRPTT